ncbi:Cytoplasmic dynein 2 heavy chain 1 [Phlyctochytrium planicorne]|nr:Cytoplasmic dynein 2 heavy chain 1 [Phlyctochytrium planicorne]
MIFGLDDTYTRRQKLYSPMPQARVNKLLNIISEEMVAAFSKRLALVKVFQDPFAKIKDIMSLLKAVGEKWIAVLKSLTGRFWPHYSPNPWVGDEFSPDAFEQFLNRIGEILEIRTTQETFSQLLSADEQRETQLRSACKPFQDVPIFSVPENVWKDLVHVYNKNISKADREVAVKLRTIFATLQGQPHQLLQEFQKYFDIVQRDIIAKNLESEKEAILNQLLSSLKVIKSEFKDRSYTVKESGRNISQCLQNIFWARQTITKIEETRKVALAISESDTSFLTYSNDLHESLKKYEKDEFSSWLADIEAILQENDTSFSLKGMKLMELSPSDGSLVVNFGESLVSLIREVRQLLSLGFPVPPKIIQSAENAQKYYRYGIVFKQVAHFYNTIHEQMLTCQYAMMLQPAKEFERLVKDPKGTGKGGKDLSWDTQAEVEDYIQKLQDAANKLTSENRRLRKFHSLICEKVVGLMGIDLVKAQTKQKWKESLATIRSFIAAAQEGKISVQDTLSWRNHWDCQIYKSLEYQYRMSLENLNQNLPEISVELVFQQQKLQFRPPFENIRANYYREMKNIINIPGSFKGLGDVDIYSQMIDKNSPTLSIVYRKTEALFLNLLTVYDKFKDWVILGTVNLESFVEEALSDVYDWEMNFRMLKTKGKEAEQLPTVIKVDCITISTAPVKATIDDHLQRLFDCLLNALRKAINAHLLEIDTFVTKGTEILSKRPETLEEIGEANVKHEELAIAKSKVAHHFESADLKNRLLKSVAGSGIDTTKVQSRWSKLELMLESHELVIKEQVEILKGAIEGRKQAFQNDMGKFVSRWKQLKPNIDDIKGTDAVKKALTFVKEKQTEFYEIISIVDQINKDCAHFGIPQVELEEVEKVKSELRACEDMWNIFEEYFSQIGAILQEDWISFRTKSNTLEDTLMTWLERIKGRPVDAVSVRIQKEIDSFRDFYPNLKFLRGDNWMTEHWGELFRILKITKGVALQDLKLLHFFNVKDSIITNLAEIKELNSRANGEVAIREALQELEMWGAGAVFSLLDYEDAKKERVKIIKDWKDTMTQVGDNQSLLQSLKDSVYYKLFADKAQLWEKRLVELDEILRNLNTVQRRWVYLEPIFSRGALPSEQNRFLRIDTDFRSIIQSISRDNRVLSIISYPSIRDNLTMLVDQLERCQKALNDFLEEKRSRFARFYFIGDDDLLEILGQSQNPNVIQAHLKKLFAGVHQVDFDESTTSIVAMKSIEGEVVPLQHPVKISTDVEKWLEDFTKEMQSTLRSLLTKCLSASDLFKFPSQILSLSEYIHFTGKCEAAITKGTLSNLSTELESQLDKYTSYDTSKIDDPVQRHTTELKIKSLILDIIHFIDVIKQIQETKSKDLADWSWQRQLRFYSQKDKFGDGCLIKMNSASFDYSFEYQGNPPKLVHTPLTDKCYLTLTQAMSSGFGGNPFGPAGTGKTESVKALGVLFGRQVLVFNCDEGIDYKSMGRIFVGLIKCGAWGCFDEFNRLEEAVLSAVSQQIQIIQAAIKSKEKHVTLLGKTVEVNLNSGIFVTLNPAGKGYGGRQKLPDNLKQLFRSVAMTFPDNELIAGVILFSEGFKVGKELGAKVVSVFTLCKQLLSSQQHYDWGLRPLKTVLGLAGQLLQTEKKAGMVAPKREATIVVKALRVNTLSKLTYADSLRFNALMKDIFPDITPEDISYDELGKAISEVVKELDLEATDAQTEKCFQLHEALRQKMGVVIVGPSGSGKTTLLQVLEKAWPKCGQKLRKHVMNPKAVDRQTLLGHMDIDTREWFDGILTFASRQAVKEPLDVHTWIICDGDIDPEWVESLNSVLDDNRLLTMPNGERIQFGPNVNFIFETHNLKFASPATVSRMGMIYLSDETLDAKALVKSWIRKQAEGLRSKIEEWINEVFFRAIDWILQNGDSVIETTKAGLIYNGLSHLSGVSSRLQFVYGLIRGLGANLYMENRLVFANEVLKWANESSPDPKRTLDFYTDAKGRLLCYEIGEPPDLDVKNITNADRLPVIETVDVKRAIDTIMPWLHQNYPVLVVGPEGAGKQMLLRYCFQQLKSTSVAVIHCSAQTRSAHLLQRLSHMCIGTTTNTGRVLRPKDAEKLILYLKDINLPRPDQYETVELIQFIQQLITYKGYFDSSLEWIGIENVLIVASLSPSNGMGRNKLSSRFTSVLRQCHISYSDREQLQTVYRILCQPVLSTYFPSHKVWGLPKNVQRLSATMVNVYDQTMQKFTVDQQPHYLFTPRDLSNWVIGLTKYQYSDEEDGELIDVLCAEAMRIFNDRLVGADRPKFIGILSNLIRAEWNRNVEPNDMIYSASQSPGGRRSSNKVLSKLSIQNFYEIISKEIMVFERDVQDLNICLFPEALLMFSKVERVLSQSGGSILFIGRPGVGRSSSVHVVAHMYGIRTFSPSVNRNYDLKEFSIFVKEILQVVGVANEPAVFILEDSQITNPIFLEYVNSLLSGGEVPGLYAPEELDTLLASLKDQHSEDGFRGTLFDFFVSRIRANLHIVLLLDASSPHLIQYCEANPALYTKCQIEWVDNWSTESMEIMAKDYFSKNPLLAEIKDVDVVIRTLLAIHSSCASRGAAPRNLTNYVRTYDYIYNLKSEEFQSKLKYLGSGLKKLQDASSYVDNLSAEAKKQGVLLAEKQKSADLALKQITDSILKASDQKKEMEILSAQLKEEEENLVQRKQAIEHELKDVEPIIKASQAAVGEIKPESLTEIRSLRAPPPAVRDVLEGVLRLMGILDMSWNSMKGFLGKRTIKDEILNFDARNITKQVRESVTELLRSKKESFEESVIKRTSQAAAPLAMWVKANIQYSVVLEKIGPLEADLQRLSKTLDASKARVSKLKEALAAVDKNVSALREDFGNKTRDAETLRSNLEKASTTIKASQGLLEKLSGEGKRWQAQVKSIYENIASLTKNALLSAAFITYLTPASEDLRQKYVNEWKALAGIQDYDFKRSMSTESEQLQWKSQGLPSDMLSFENAISIINGKCTPLIVDPSSQAVVWLKNYLSAKKPEIIKQHDENFIRTFELAIRFGKTLIVEDVNTIEPLLYPVLKRELIKQGPRFMISLGEKTVDFNENFRLYLITSKGEFNLPSEAAGLVSEINFTITRAGLAGQLLGITLQHEKPELEVEKIKLLKKEDELKIQLSSLEESLLKELASSDGNILENNSLIESLNETKSKSISISNGLQESHKLQAALDAERDKFTPLSQFGSALFFVVSDLKKLNNMYDFSLASFLRLFEQALRSEGSTKNDGTDLRIKLLIGSLEKLTYKYVSRSLFNSDRQMFALYLIHELHEVLFEGKEWNIFTGQSLIADVEDSKRGDIPSWIPHDSHNNYQLLQASIPNFCAAMSFSDSDNWSRWIKSSFCEQEIPAAIAKKISPFQRVLLVQTFRPDRLMSAMNAFAINVLGIQSLTPPPLNFKRIFTEETIPEEPILFITTPGADPSQELRDFAMKEMGADKFREVSMGQGQGEIAISELKKMAASGGWLCLQNVHLVINWLPKLEKELKSLIFDKNFRLWMTSEAHAKFPPSLLQKCLKITAEAPPGIKKNLQRIYEGWSPEYIGSGSPLRAQSLFALAWFHAVIQERRTYIPQGWNKFYEFSAADLRSSAELLTTMCASSGGKAPQWQIFHGLIENAIYGGRIDDLQDDLKLQTYLQLYFNDDVFAIGGRAATRKLAKGIALPSISDHQAFMAVINDLPEADNVALFGLPLNIDRALQRSSSQVVLDQLKILRYHDLQSQKFEKEKWSRELMPFLQLWKKLNTGNDLLQKKIGSSPDVNPIDSFLTLELVNALSLLRKIHADLSGISKVLRGTALLSNDVMAVAGSLLKSETPKAWLSLWEGPESPQDYMRESINNSLAVDTWRNKASGNGNLFAEPLQLCNLFNPITFLNALRQQTSRKVRKPMDELVLYSTWSRSDISHAALSVAVDGLLLQGCSFDGLRLSESSTDDPSYQKAPICYIAWVPKGENSHSRIDIPLYLTPTRERLVGFLQIPGTDDKSTWILAGVAFFLLPA